MEFYVGTLTREGGAGILRCSLSGNKLECLSVIDGLTDPNYLILHPGRQRLYAVSSDAEGTDTKGCVNEYDLTGKAPLLISRQTTFGNAPCHLTVSPDRRFLYCANYGTGSLAVFPAEDKLRPAVQVIQHQGSGPNIVRQAGPHVHQVCFIPDTQYLCACDLGTDHIEVYTADIQTGRLTHHSSLHLHGGPRHLLFADNTLGYLCHELSSEVTVLSVQNGILSARQTLSALPENVPNTSAAIRISADHRHLYVSNRGHGSIAIYNILENGQLIPVRWFMEAGSYPRDFALLKDGRILVADQRAGVRLLDAQGRMIHFLSHVGAVCICCNN